MTGQTAPGTLRSIAVFERQPFWEPEFRRQFQRETVSIRACRAVSDLEQLTTASNCVAIANLADGPAEVLRWMSRRLTSGRSLPVVIVTTPATTAFAWHAREAGAMAVISENIGGHQLARLCRKQWSAPTLEFNREST